jgi:hypothetical protein
MCALLLLLIEVGFVKSGGGGDGAVEPMEQLNHKEEDLTHRNPTNCLAKIFLRH